MESIYEMCKKGLTRLVEIDLEVEFLVRIIEERFARENYVEMVEKTRVIACVQPKVPRIVDDLEWM